MKGRNLRYMNWAGPLYVTSIKPGRASVTPKTAVRGVRGLLHSPREAWLITGGCSLYDKSILRG